MTRFSCVKRFILDIFYPNRCPLCGKVIKYDGYICDNCLNGIRSTDDFCQCCGFLSCKCNEKKYYDLAFSAGIYDGNLREALINLKKEKNNELIEFFACKISKKLGGLSFDLIVYVPMTKERKRKSGFNQAHELAKGLSKELGIPICKNAVIKVKDYKHHELSGVKREDAVKGAYIKGNAVGIKNKRIILVDDIMTTGSTVNECSRILKEMGASFIAVASAAKTNDVSELNRVRAD